MTVMQNQIVNGLCQSSRISQQQTKANTSKPRIFLSVFIGVVELISYNFYFSTHYIDVNLMSFLFY